MRRTQAWFMCPHYSLVPQQQKFFFSNQHGLPAIRITDFINGKGGYLQVQHITEKRKVVLQ